MDDPIQHLYEQYAHDVYRFARLMLGDPEEAKDAAQEVFVRAHRAWPRFQGRSSARTWLMSIARNYLYDQVRRRRVQSAALTAYQQFHADRAEQEPDTGRREDLQVLEEAIGMLKPAYRQVFILRHVEELSVSETAAILNWSSTKVTTTDQRAIQQLRSMFGGEWN